VAVGVAEDLDLDVAAVHDGALEDELAAAERGGGLGAGGADRGGELGLGLDLAHASTAAAGRGFDQDGESDLEGLGVQALVGLAVVGAVLKARDAGDAGGDHGALGLGLVAHGVDGVRARADEDEAGVEAGLRELGVLGEEAVAGVDRVGAGVGGGGEQALDVEVRVAHGGRADEDGAVGEADVGGVGVGLAVDGDGAVAEGVGAADDAAGDLAAVGDQDGAEGRHVRMSRSSGLGPLRAALLKEGGHALDALGAAGGGGEVVGRRGRAAGRARRRGRSAAARTRRLVVATAPGAQRAMSLRVRSSWSSRPVP
jgi:hypothetical protein